MKMNRKGEEEITSKTQVNNIIIVEEKFLREIICS
jgi:hypothetical protein